MSFRWICLLLFLHSTFTVKAQEPPQALIAVPDTCVALREGRNCYADVSLTWEQPAIGNYCLRDATSKYIMQCWLKQQSGTFNYAFDSQQSISFELFDSNTSKIISIAEVKLQWVYQNRQKTSLAIILTNVLRIIYG
ncbi:signal peptide [Pseudoalteromonas sp. BSi20652]|nr:signal peptide [Pseudoalteromonas sp. BSi20652]